MKVECHIIEFVQQNERGIPVPSLAAVCPRCLSSTRAFGVTDKSLKRCLWLMRESCSCPESNRTFYTGKLPKPPEPTDSGFFAEHGEQESEPLPEPPPVVKPVPKSKPKVNPPHWTDRL